MREGELSAGRVFVTWRSEFFSSFIFLIFYFSIGTVSLLLFLQFTKLTKSLSATRKPFLTWQIEFPGIILISLLLSYMKAKSNLLLLFSLQNLQGISLLCKRGCLLVYFTWQLRFGIMHSNKT